MVLDENRIKNRRKDCLVCCRVKDEDEDADREEGPEQRDSNLQSAPLEAVTEDKEETLHMSGRIMSWYADKLLVPWVKVAVIVAFTALFGLCIWSTTQLRLFFDFKGVLPSDSYVIEFFDSVQYVTRQGPSPYIYFRFVDQSDPDIQQQMHKYVEDMVDTGNIAGLPFHFWLDDYEIFVSKNQANLTGLAFNEILGRFLEESDVDYTEDVELDENGYILASRTLVHMDNFDATNPNTGLDAFKQQSNVAMNQPVNQNTGDAGEFPFFMFEPIFLLLEFINATPAQLTNSTIVGIASVSIMSLVFMPHWSGILFVAPMVAVLYVNLMGFIQLCGVDINGVSYVSLLMAIGLLVDYVMHVTLRYFESTATESRDAKTKDVLRTMGASVLLGGLSTFLGILPLAFSSSSILLTFVITFTGVVFLGLSHGLVLLPVLLSLLGPRGHHSLGPVGTVSKIQSTDGKDKRERIIFEI